MEHCLAAGGDFIIRIKNKAFNIYDADGGKLVFTDWLRTVSETAEELNVYIRNSEKKLVPLRICACKKTKAEIAAEKVRIKKMESKKQKKLSDETVFTHNYMFVITSLPAEISAAEILSCYRLRWQVELVFKRLKSLLQLGSIPTKTEEAGEAWINGKILLSLLTEKYLGDIDFSPSWNIRSQSECMEGDEAGILYNFCGHTCPACRFVRSPIHGAKNGGRVFLRSLRFSSFSDTLCGSLYDDKLLFVHIVQHPVNMFPALTFAAQLVRVEKFIHGNIKKGNELVKGVEAGVLAPVLNIHDGARGEVYKLGQVLLRPAFGFSSALDFLAQGMTVQAFFILVHSHITPILFYISG